MLGHLTRESVFKWTQKTTTWNNQLHIKQMLSAKIRQKKDLRSFNPNHAINLSKFTRNLENISNELKQHFQNKTVLLATTQPKNLQMILTKAKFEENLIPSPLKEDEFFLWWLYLPQMWIYHSVQIFSI